MTMSPELDVLPHHGAGPPPNEAAVAPVRPLVVRFGAVGDTVLLTSMSIVSRLLERGGIDRTLEVRQVDNPWRIDALEHHHAWLLRLAAIDPPGIEPRPPFDGPLPRPHLEVTPAEIADCEGWLAERGWAGSPVVVVQIASRRASRGRWPFDCWAAIVRAILERMPAARVLFAGTAKEAPVVRALVEATAHPRAHGAAGELPIRRLIAVLMRAHSCLSLDTGPAHIAAAVGCPVVVLAGPVHPDLYQPVGAPGRVEVVTGMPPAERPRHFEVFSGSHTVEMVAPDAVLEAWERVSAPKGICLG